MKIELRRRAECKLQTLKSTTRAVRNICVITSPDKKCLRFFLHRYKSMTGRVLC